jgi:hypothetical protein
MTAFRVIKQFGKEGFLEQEHSGLRLVRKKELTDRWLAANQSTALEIAGRWLHPRGKDALRDAHCAHVSAGDKSPSKFPITSQASFIARQPRASLGLFAAADALGLGFGHSVRPYLYVERAERNALESLGLSTNGMEQNADVCIRIPRNRESVFRGAVFSEGVPASDILQVWLDVDHHPSRGKENADLIWKKFLAPALLDKDEQWPSKPVPERQLAVNRENGTDWIRVPGHSYSHYPSRLPVRVGDRVIRAKHEYEASEGPKIQYHTSTRPEGRGQEIKCPQ